MDDPFGMRSVEGVGQLNRDVQQRADQERTGVKLLIEVLSLEKFHGDKRLRFRIVARPFFDCVDCANIRMV